MCDKAYKQADLLEMEGNILGLLNFNMLYNSSFSYLSILSDICTFFLKIDINKKIDKVNSKVYYLSEFILHKVLSSVIMNRLEGSIQATSAIYLSCKLLDRDENINLFKD